MKDFNVRDFFLGIFITLLILVPLFFFFMLPRHYQGLRADIDANQESIVEILEHNPHFRENVYWLIREMDGFEDQMNERTKMILTRDMPIEVTVEPSEKN